MAARRRVARRARSAARRLAIYRPRSQYNYFRLKIDWIDKIISYPTSETPPIVYAYYFTHGSGIVPGNLSPVLSVADILAGNSQFARLADVFALCKLKAVSMEVVPASGAGTVSEPACVAYFNSNVASPTFAQIAECPASLMLDPTKKKTKYVSLLGNTGDWSPVAAASFAGKFAVGQGVDSAGANFNVKISLYMIFKQSLI